MEIVKTIKLIHDYIVRDEEGNETGKVRAIDGFWATTAPASPRWQNT